MNMALEKGFVESVFSAMQQRAFLAQHLCMSHRKRLVVFWNKRILEGVPIDNLEDCVFLPHNARCICVETYDTVKGIAGAAQFAFTIHKQGTEIELVDIVRLNPTVA